MSRPAPLTASSDLPLCVDLDNTLARVDTLHELLLAQLKSLSGLLGIIRALSGGRANLKRQLASRSSFDPTLVPYHRGLVTWLTGERARGRKLALATGADLSIAQAVAKHLGLFDEVLGSDGTANLKAAAKARCLVDRYGLRGFVYVGDSSADLAVWREAAAAIPVGASRRLEHRVAEVTAMETRFDREGSGAATAALRALRPKQWVKNALLFVPILTARAFGDIGAWNRTVWAFGAMCAAASAVYLINDLSDLTSDRQHPTKRDRPIASGDLGSGMAAALVLLLGIVAAIAAFHAGTLLPVGGYAAMGLAYSLIFKRYVLVDVFLLAGLYVLRVITGGLASGYFVSPWLLGFCGFLFLSLALMKRDAELRARGLDSAPHNDRRAYQSEDRPFLEVLGVGCSVTSTLVLALYAQAHSTQVVITNPWALWAVAPTMLFWQSRLWLATYRGRMEEDPILFAIHDWVTRLSALVVMGLFVLSGL